MNKKNIKISITGANGFIGSHITGALELEGYEVYNVPTDYLHEIKNNTEYFDENITPSIQSSDCIIHLAARNNNREGSESDFFADNVLVTRALVIQCKETTVKKFIFTTSTKCLESGCNDLYTKSKRQAERELLDLSFNSDTGMEITVCRLPPVYGNKCKGTLRHLGSIPAPLRAIATNVLRSLTPIASLDSVKNNFIDIINKKNRQYETMVGDPLGELSPYWLFYAITTIAFVLLSALLLPVLLIVAAAVKFTSDGPAVFVQDRVGKNKKIFKCYKFRTMAVDTPDVGTHEVNSASVTKVGGFLRNTKLDEIPQVINVLRGDMTLIGPRPCLPSQLDVISNRENHGVYSIIPGITGHAQVNKVDMSRPELISVYDQRYVRGRSIIGDIKICVDTVLGKGKGDPAFNKAE